MSFDFSDLVVPDDENDNYDYTQFLADPIYDWLNSPEEILQVCDDIEEERKKSYNYTTTTTTKYSHMEKSLVSTRAIPQKERSK